MQRALTVIHALGLMLIVFSVSYLIPVAASLIYDDGTTIDFLLAMVWTSAIGFLMWLLTRNYKGELSIRHGYLLVLMVADLTPEAAIKLQQEGLGEGRKFGCGLFLPQKGIKAVNADS